MRPSPPFTKRTAGLRERSNLDRELERPIGLSRRRGDLTGIPRVAELAIVKSLPSRTTYFSSPSLRPRRLAAIEPPCAEQTPTGRDLGDPTGYQRR